MRAALLSACFVFAVAEGLTPAPLSAQEPPAGLEEADLRLPLALAARPITLTGDTIRIDTGLAVFHAESPNRTFAVLSGGAAGGLGDDFEIGALFAPVQVAPESRWLDPSVLARLRLFASVVELGLEVEWRIPVEPGSATAFIFALPLRWHVVPRLALDLVPRVGVKLLDSPATQVAVPLSATVSITPELFAGARIGVSVLDAAFAYLEASVFFGGTLLGPDGPTADLRAELYFPSVTDGTEEVVVALTASFYLFP